MNRRPIGEAEADEPAALHRMRWSLERIAPAIWPLTWVTAMVAAVAIIVFMVLAFKHLEFGGTALNMGITEAVAQTVAGILGTAFAGITSLLLVATLWVQIHEYRLTRQELVNTVEAQRKLAKSHEEQLAPLKEQAEVSRMAMEMDLLTRAMMDVKQDMREFDAPAFTTEIGLIPVMRLLTHRVNDVVRSRRRGDYVAQEVAHINQLTQARRTMTGFSVLMDRARMLDEEFGRMATISRAASIREKEHAAFVKKELTGIGSSLTKMKSRLTELPDEPESLRQIKQKLIELTEKTLDDVMYFNGRSLLKD